MLRNSNARPAHTLYLTFGTASALRRQIEAGEPFDVAILRAPAIDDLITQGKLHADTRTDVARSGIGIAVRAGAPKPDIRTVEALKRALLDLEKILLERDLISAEDLADVSAVDVDEGR